jgi:hypothetical protein
VYKRTFYQSRVLKGNGQAALRDDILFTFIANFSTDEKVFFCYYISFISYYIMQTKKRIISVGVF